MTDQAGNIPVDLPTQRFVQSIHQALVVNKYSQRELCSALGITIGTLTKYLRAAVNPNNVGVSKIRALAKELGITTNSLLDYYDTGEYRSTLTIDDVAGWIRSSAGQEDLPQLLAAASEASMRTSIPPVELSKPLMAFTDEDAEMFMAAVRNAMKEASVTAGVSARQIWSQIEEQLVILKCEPEEVNTLFELSFGIIDFTGETMTKARAGFAGRFPTFCPLIRCLRKVGHIADFSALDAAEARLCAA